MPYADIEKMIARLQSEIARLSKVATDTRKKVREPRKVLFPAKSEQLARFAQFCELHGIKPTETEKQALTQIVEKLERRLRTAEPAYRFHALAPAKTGRRTVNKRCWPRIKPANETPDLFGN